jgi:Ca-activated chloride channel family protein
MRRVRASAKSLTLIAGLLAGLLPAIVLGAIVTLQEKQQPNPQQPPKPAKPEPDKPANSDSEVIRINSSLIAVPVSVTDDSGQAVKNLRVDDFRVIEEGQPQQVTTLGEPGKTPIDLVLLFDASGSVRERFDFERTAASRFLREVLKPKDFASIFSFGLTPHLVKERTAVVDQAVAGVHAIEPTSEATAFFDAVGKAAQYITDNAEAGSRRVLVVVSDGEDNQSQKFTLTTLLRELHRSDAVFYSINPSGPSIRLNKISMRGQGGMAQLASETGGAAFVPDKIEDLDQVFKQIAAELQAQYLLGYYSSNERNDGRFRRIEVRVPTRPGLRVRARQGYFAPKD